ncbi:hypothetical protein GCM10022200_11440 [Microbacterium awajiense]|uniref:Secreted protein n=1 Tax=Microbacterium awajiense TaxID=415214 RepID=A0ABP7AEF1_9MICO
MRVIRIAAAYSWSMNGSACSSNWVRASEACEVESDIMGQSTAARPVTRVSGSTAVRSFRSSVAIIVLHSGGRVAILCVRAAL